MRVDGELLGTALRASDAPCRYGGEEFAVILPDTGREGAHQAAERIRAGLAALKFSHKQGEFSVTASIGLGVVEALPPDGRNADALVKLADDGLYVAKRGGRDRVCEVGSDA